MTMSIGDIIRRALREETSQDAHDVLRAARELADGLKVLRLDDFMFLGPLDPSTAVELSRLLSTNTTIEELHVSYDQTFSLDALGAIFGGLAENNTLKSLYITPILMVNDNDEEIFTQMFRTNLNLQHLDLKGCPIRRTGAFALAAMLKTNTTLQVLNLSMTRIDHVGASSIARALKNNHTLLELDLSHLRLPFADDLAHALHSNSTLKILKLNESQFCDGGAIALADALDVNCTLKVLSLKSCRIGAVGAIALGEVVRRNGILEELNLEGNEVGKMGGQKLLGGLQRSWRLKKLTFDSWSAAAKSKVEFWQRLTPCGRAIMKESVRSSLMPKVLHRIDQDGGADSIYTVIRERPDIFVSSGHRPTGPLHQGEFRTIRLTKNKRRMVEN